MPGLVATVRKSRRPFRDSGLCGKRMRRPVLSAAGEKVGVGAGRMRRVVSSDRNLSFRQSERSVHLACRVRLICWSLSFGPSRPTGTGAERRRSGWSLRLTCPVRFVRSGLSFGLSCLSGAETGPPSDLSGSFFLVGNVVRTVLAPGRSRAVGFFFA